MGDRVGTPGRHGPGGRTVLLGFVGLFASLLLLSLTGCDETPKSRRAEAKALLEAGETERAIEELRAAAAEDPGNPETQLALGMTLLQAGRTTEAIFPLSNAARSEELGRQAGVVLASTLSQEGNYEEAIAATDRVLESHPAEEGALMVRATAAMRLHRHELALEAIDRLLALQPDSVLYRHMRAEVLAEAGRRDEAVALLRELMASSPADHPEAPHRACAGLARLYVEAGERDRALDQLRTCEGRMTDRPYFVVPMAELYDRLERAEDGTALLERMVERHPRAQRIREELGKRWALEGRFEEAEALALQGPADDADPAQWATVSSLRRTAGDLRGALEAIDRAIAGEAAPSQEHLFARAELHLALGDLEAAEAALDELTEPLYARTLRARIAQAKGRPQEALELYDEVLPRWPHNHAIRVFAARAALEVGDRERAKQELLEATRQAPKETDAALWLARLHFGDGEYTRAADMAQRQVTERGPTQPDAYILAARAYARAGDLQRARSALGMLATVREGRFEGHAVAELGRLLAEKRGAAEALASYETLLEEHDVDLADRRNQRALTQLLELHVAADRVEEAGSRLETLLAEHPDAPVLHAMRGRVALLRGEHEAAEAAFARALELDPELPAGLAGRALLRRDRGDLPGASEAMDRAWSLGGTADHGYMAARLHLALGHREEAAARLEELLRLHPDHAGAANDLAWLLAEDGERLARAEDLAELALRLAPGAEVLDTLGYVRLRRGEVDAATDLFRRALEARPGYATARYHLALALHQQGRTQEARESLEAALEASSFPESDEARALLARLEGNEEKNVP